MGKIQAVMSVLFVFPFLDFQFVVLCARIFMHEHVLVRFSSVVLKVMTYFGDVFGISVATLLGKIDQFDPELEEWTQYVERLDQFSSPTI